MTSITSIILNEMAAFELAKEASSKTTNPKITSIDPDPYLAGTLVGFESHGRPYKTLITDQNDLVAMMSALLRGEMDLEVHTNLKTGQVTTELVRANRKTV